MLAALVDLPRDDRTLIAKALTERRLRAERDAQAEPGGLVRFVRYFWHVLEPQTPLVEGWALGAICEHLEAVTDGKIKRLLINVPPGFMKSLLVNVFWPAWEWGARDKPHLRYVTFSYAASLTERDNGRFRDLLLSQDYQDLWGHRFELTKTGETKVANAKTGWKLASSVGGVGTGERGDRVLLDDPHNVKEAESDVVRDETVRWFRESMSSRLNNMAESVIVVIMQRVHETDVSGAILSEGMGYEHLMLPMEFDPDRRCVTSIGWTDPRKRTGSLAWPARFPPNVVLGLQRDLGPYAYAGQYQQRPTPRGGGMFKRDWWQAWEPPDNKYPAFDFILASLDSAFTEKQENDPSGFTVWGVWNDPETGFNRVMLVDAWRKRLQMHGNVVKRGANETNREYVKRASPEWGLVEWVGHSCRKWKVDRLIIEAKASGITAAQEMLRLYSDDQWSTQLEPVKGDKVSRAHAVVPTFSQGLVYAPYLGELPRDFAEMVIEEMETFPKARHDDLTDSATQAMKFLRVNGFLHHPGEHRAEEERRAMHRSRPAPLYPV